jgi:Ca2+-transporting ATPase
LLSRGFLYSIGLYAVLIAAPVLAVIVWQTVAGVPYERAITMNFAVLGFAQLLHLGNARDDAPVLSWRRAIANRAALVALVIGAFSLFAVIQSPALAQWLRLVPLSATDWAVVLGLALVPAVVGQAVKVARGWMQMNGAVA